MNKEEFKKAISELNIQYTNKMLNQLEEYCDILIEENKKYNLTSITNKESIYLKHFLDSLTITKIIDLNNQSLCDIGTGAGFPGLVLKIFYPNLDVTLIEATNKKCNFLNLVINKLHLNKIKVINERAEIYSKTNREIFDIVTSRAVAPLPHLLEYSTPIIKVNGYLISMKGNVEEELKLIFNYNKKLYITLLAKKIFKLPVENSTRTLLIFQKYKETPSKYPRSYKDIKSKPLK